MSYKRYQGIFHARPLYPESSKGIGTVQDDHLHVLHRRYLHHVAHGADVGVGAAAYVLDVVDYCVQVLQLVG